MKNQKGRWLYILGLSVLGIGVLALICTLIFELAGNEALFRIFGIIVSIAGPVAIILLVIKLLVYGGAPSPAPREPIQKPSKREMPTVDVKDIPKSKEEMLYDQYVDLYNKKLISKEDLDKKRQELIGK